VEEGVGVLDDYQRVQQDKKCLENAYIQEAEEKLKEALLVQVVEELELELAVEQEPTGLSICQSHTQTEKNGFMFVAHLQEQEEELLAPGIASVVMALLSPLLRHRAYPRRRISTL
jgi:hypothetical protein